MIPFTVRLGISSPSVLPLLSLSFHSLHLLPAPHPPLPFCGVAKSAGAIVESIIHSVQLHSHKEVSPVHRVVIKLTAFPAARRHQPNGIFMDAADAMADLH